MSDGDKSLPIIDLAYRLRLEINQAVVKLPRHQRPGVGRRLEEAAFDLLAALFKARYLGADAKAGALSQGSQALETLRHDVLLDLCQRRLRDEALADLLARFLVVWGQWSDTPGVGIPPGSAVSSLPSNLYLDPFDHRLKDELGYARFADSYNFRRRLFADFRSSRNHEKR